MCPASHAFHFRNPANYLILISDVSPTFLETFKTRKLQPGPSISLRCIATGTPKPKILWTFNGRPAINNQKHIIRQKAKAKGIIESTLIIKNTKATDGGIYSCNATNKLQSMVHAKAIQIYGLPIVQQMDNVTITAGENLRIRCYVSGYPVEYIRWERGLCS